MSDIAIVLTDEDNFDLAIENGDFAKDLSLKTNILMSIFSEARASDEQITGRKDKKGWLGDLNSMIPIGSLLWLQSQSRLDQLTLNNIITETRKALQWLIDKGYASKIFITGDIVPKRGFDINVKLTTSTGKDEDYGFKLWSF